MADLSPQGVNSLDPWRVVSLPKKEPMEKKHRRPVKYVKYGQTM